MPSVNEISRRKFLADCAILAAAATTLPAGSFAKETMRTRLIPGTDEALPVVGLGAPEIFIKLPPEGKALPKAVIQTMVDLGGRVIDTPPWFRPDVPVIGEILTEMGLQGELFLTGKITVSGKQEGIEHLEKTVRNLNKRPIDCLMVHNMRELKIHWPTLKDWKEAGRVRYIGVSLTRTADFSGLEKFMKDEGPDFIMPGYSITQQGPAARVLPLAADNGIAVITAEPFKAREDGAYFAIVAGKSLPEWASEFDCESWAQFSLKYILSNPAVTCVVTETRKVSHAADNMRAGYGQLPDEATRQRMSEYFLAL
jgi:diketogulonate reductase-like aldo/keto reductase